MEKQGKKCAKTECAMRKILSFVFALAIAVCVMPAGACRTDVGASEAAGAQDAEICHTLTEEEIDVQTEVKDDEDEILTFVADDGIQWKYSIVSENSVEIRAGSKFGEKTEITIPAEIESMKVTHIGEYAFNRCYNLAGIAIPNSVTTISHCAFKDCISLTDIRIPNSVATIDYGVFEGCTSLADIRIPDGVTNIEDSLCKGCTGLTSVTIPGSVTSIEFSVFEGCTGLTSITIPSSVINIGSYVFRDCSALTSIVIPKSVTSIGVGAFSGCSGLTSISVDPGNAVYTSGKDANAIIDATSGILISGCRNTKIPSSVTGIGEYAFRGCSGLTSITIPDSVTSIGHEAFEGCSGLTRIVIPRSVTDITTRYNIFASCANLASITVDADNPVYTSGENANAIIDTTSGTLISGCKNTKIPDSVASIGNSAFEGCSFLTSVTIPNSVTYISDSAFSGCSSLTSITIPESVTTLSLYAFRDCSNLKRVEILGRIKSIQDYAFYRCSSLESIALPTELEDAHLLAFYGCDNVREIYYAGSESQWKKIKYFYDTYYDPEKGRDYHKDMPLSDYFKDATVHYEYIAQSTPTPPATEETTQSQAPAVEPPTSPTPAPTAAPTAQPKGSAIEKADGKNDYKVTKTGKDATAAFQKADKKTTSVKVPATVRDSAGVEYKVTEIAANAFKNNKKVKTVTIDKNITTIGKNAFSGCKNLKKITIKSIKIGSIKSNAFKGLPKNAKIKVPKSKKKDYTKLLRKAGFQGKIK